MGGPVLWPPLYTTPWTLHAPQLPVRRWLPRPSCAPEGPHPCCSLGGSRDAGPNVREHCPQSHEVSAPSGSTQGSGSSLTGCRGGAWLSWASAGNAKTRASAWTCLSTEHRTEALGWEASEGRSPGGLATVTLRTGGLDAGSWRGQGLSGVVARVRDVTEGSAECWNLVEDAGVGSNGQMEAWWPPAPRAQGGRGWSPGAHEDSQDPSHPRAVSTARAGVGFLFSLETSWSCGG